MQEQLDPKYHNDERLRDSILTVVDIPHIRSSLKERVPDNAQQALNHVASHLCENPKNAENPRDNLLSAHFYCTENTADIHDEDGKDCSSLGQKYGGRARNNLKPLPRRDNRRGAQSNRDIDPRNQRKVNHECSRGNLGCFVGQNTHHVSDRHYQDEVSAAIQKLKQNHPSANVLRTSSCSSMVMDISGMTIGNPNRGLLLTLHRPSYDLWIFQPPWRPNPGFPRCISRPRCASP